METQNNSFSINDTRIIKGIAIFCMVLHHLVGKFYNSFNVEWYFQNSEDCLSFITLLFSTSGKVCVSLLTILSGYGLAKSMQKTAKVNTRKCLWLRFPLSHLIQLYSIYWVNFFVVMLLLANTSTKIHHYFGDGFTCVLNLFGNFFGLNHIFFGDWFVQTIIVLYIVFPLLYMLVKKLGYVMLFLSFVPVAIRVIWPHCGLKFDCVLLCLWPFVIGIYLAYNDLLTKLKNTGGKYVTLSWIFLILTFILRLLFSLPVDWIFALAIIAFSILVISPKTRCFGTFLAVFGEYSATIWLMHLNILWFLRHIFLFSPSFSLLIKYFLGMFIALLYSMVLKYIEDKMGYTSLVKKTRALLL